MRRGIPPRATPADLRQLREAQRSSSDPRVVRRATALVMLSEGLRVKEVCRLTGLCRRAIEKIRARWNKGRCASLADRPRPGRPPRATRAFRRELVRTVQTTPLKWRYGFTVWNTARLAEHLFLKTRIRLSPRRISEMLKEERFSFGVPAHTLKGKRSEKDHGRAKARLRRLKKGLSRPILLFASALEMRAASTSIPI